ncbi:MAG: hypothetical protein HKM02_00370 [Pseudomonadales bacterium]|nr:hypothetical protein [Pseudomonadales bacterium]
MSRAHFASIAGPERLSLISLWQIMGFVLVVVVALLEIHRLQHLSLQAAADTEHDSVAIAYLHAWLKTEPDNDELRLLLVRKLLHGRELSSAQKELAPLTTKNNLTARAEIRSLWQELLWRHLWSFSPQSSKFSAAAHQYLKTLAWLNHLALSPQERWVDAHQAEALHAPDLALTLIQAGHRSDRLTLLYEIHLSTALGLKLVSAQYWFILQDQSTSIAEARIYFLRGLTDLQSSGKTRGIAELAYNHLHRLQHDPQALASLARLAMATGDTELAAQFIAASIRQQLLPAPPSR